MKKEYRYNPEINSKYGNKKQELVEYIIEKGYGATINYAEVGKILGLNIYDELELHNLKSVVSHLKNFLIEKGIVLKTIIGIGYYILKPEQIAGHCYHTYILRTERLLGKSAKILNHTDTSGFSEIRREEYNNVVDLTIDVQSAIANVVEGSEYYKKKKIYDELEK